MSLRAIKWAMQQTTGSATAKAVLLVLAEAADASGSAHPSQATIADALEVSDRAVRTALSLLEDGGFIASEMRMRKRGKGRTSNRYHLNLAEAGSGYQPEGDSGRCDQPEAGSGKSTDQPEAGSGASSSKTEPEDNTPPVVPPAENGKRRPSKRCPADWDPNDAHRELAREMGVDFALTIAKLRDHEFGTARSDWDATARNWIRKEAEMRPKRAASGNGMILPFDAQSREPAPPPQKTRMQLDHEARIRKALGR